MTGGYRNCGERITPGIDGRPRRNSPRTSPGPASGDSCSGKQQGCNGGSAMMATATQVASPCRHPGCSAA